ncbi:(4Fe-4S)-binding protein [Maribacter sp. PR1]|uniref:(4Fe-4S)-binding protein n=1 Tax=Maribacter cobaltidurans TaxID=1178778 RepID=A0ABU7IQ92_9FLAO|nr:MULTISPECIES: (4Fe-4S)-binding protein [Maribacter]MDC6387655.1 (4Fe-4S)-binding protein [Maribacter sp. PR1]MEE1975043.1 (4Fe-4S)-binding protein [Maribacter cobaltidurans]
MDKEIIKEYTNGELTVVWKPKKCIHSEVCVKKLPEVYKPQEKPWITPEEASTSALKAQINECPSGALTFYMNHGEKQKVTKSDQKAEVTVLANGPLKIIGDLHIQLASGETVQKEGATGFCRCGASENKPFCDGSHRKIKFIG